MEGEAERFDPGRDGPDLAYEHLHRYALAAAAVDGLEVLDLAAGSGYGSSLLAVAAARVVSLDLEQSGLAQTPNGVRGDALQLPFHDGSFDAVVCFEAIEHVPDPERLIAEARRVLRDPAILIVSTPDREIYTDRAGHRNPYHVAEMSRAEFEERLRARFRHVRLFGQGLWAGSWVGALPLDGRAGAEGERTLQSIVLGDGPGTGARMRSEGRVRWAARQGVELPTPVYLVAACADTRSGDQRLRRRLPRESLLHDPAQWLLGQYDRLVQAWGGEVDAFQSQLSRARAGQADLEAQLAAAREAAASLEAERRSAQDNARDMLGQIEKARAAVASLERERDALHRELEAREERLERQGRIHHESATRLEAEIAVARDAHADLDAQLAEARRHHADLEAQLEAARHVHAELEAQLVRSAEIVAAKDEEIAAARRANEERAAASAAEAAEHRASITDLEGQVARARDLIDALRSEIDAARRVIGGKDQELDAARDVVGGKDRELDRARETIARKDEEIDSARATIDAKASEIDVARREAITLEAMIDALRGDRERLEREREAALARAERVASERDGSRAERDRARSALADCEAAIGRLEGDLARARATAEARSEQAAAVQADLEARLAASEARLLEMQQAVERRWARLGHWLADRLDRSGGAG
jgi:SAM-dependent methyltransferase